MKLSKITAPQKRALAIFTVIALIFGAYFIRNFFILIFVAGISAFLFTPLYNRLHKKMSASSSATLTFLAAFLTVIIPIILITILGVYQIHRMIDTAAQALDGVDLSQLGNKVVEFINNILDKIPYVTYHVTPESLQHTVSTLLQQFGTWALGVLKSSASGFFGAFTSAIIFIYVFIAMLVHKDKLIEMFRKLNPLGDDIATMYLDKTGAMVKGTIKGQFIIAVCQGFSAALSLYIGGIHEAFFIFFIFLSALSIIPLGAGIIVIPIGIGMILTGNPVGGIFVIAWHLLVTTNIDNVLRPILVPKQARLNPALMMLAVFSGIAMFGFWGIVLGPVIMILIVTTINVYLAVYRSVPLVDPPEASSNGSKMFNRLLGKKKQSKTPNHHSYLT